MQAEQIDKLQRQVKGKGTAEELVAMVPDDAHPQLAILAKLFALTARLVPPSQLPAPRRWQVVGGTTETMATGWLALPFPLT